MREIRQGTHVFLIALPRQDWQTGLCRQPGGAFAYRLRDRTHNRAGVEAARSRTMKGELRDVPRMSR